VDIRASVGPNVVFDAEAGPIIVHRDAVIRPNCVLCGPCSIGPGSVVVDRAHIRANTVIGPVCRVGGEVGGTIFQGYANKSHEGHLGDSWVGKWANLGAGTTNSNLLNTYGEVAVRLEPGGSFHRTGQTFLGAIIGDHVKTAILTRLMTGVVLGTGAMIASSKPPPPAVRRFAWLTDDGERTYRFDKFIEVARAVMARRGKTPRPEYLAAIEALYRSWTSDEATRAG
jgi:UDP-N-acetylglucosamine diphosphorylase/glucosamine-1-phosphate N-acetyltransferase